MGGADVAADLPPDDTIPAPLMEARRILVTGAAGPIGAAIAVAIAPGASHLVLVDEDTEGLERSAGRARTAAEELGERVPVVLTHAADLSIAGAASDALAVASGFCGPLDVVVHAPRSDPRPVADPPDRIAALADQRAVVQLHLLSALELVDGALEPMARRGSGRLVLIGPDAAWWSDGPGSGRTDTRAALRGAVAGLVRSAAARQVHGGPTVHGVLLGGTPLTAPSGPTDHDATSVASMVTFLAGRDGSRFNGAVLPMEPDHGPWRP